MIFSIELDSNRGDCTERAPGQVAQGRCYLYSYRTDLTLDHKQMTLAEAQKLTLRVLKQVMEEKLDQHNVQLAQVWLYPVPPTSRRTIDWPAYL